MAAVRTAPAEEDTDPTEETALEKAVAALTILSKKKWQSGCSRGGGQPRGGQGGGRSGGQGKKSLCERHEKFGEDTWHCENPKTCSLGEKQVGRGVAAASTADDKPSHLALLKDRSEGRS